MSSLRQKLAVAVMVVNNDNKVLLIKGHRGWEFPGGYVELSESIKKAAIREVKEESGIIVDVTNFIGIDQIVSKSTCVFLFIGRPTSGKLTTSEESSEVGYYTIDEAINMISIDFHKNRIKNYLNKNYPFLNEI